MMPRTFLFYKNPFFCLCNDFLHVFRDDRGLCCVLGQTTSPTSLVVQSVVDITINVSSWQLFNTYEGSKRKWFPKFALLSVQVFCWMCLFFVSVQWTRESSSPTPTLTTSSASRSATRRPVSSEPTRGSGQRPSGCSCSSLRTSSFAPEAAPTARKWFLPDAC